MRSEVHPVFLKRIQLFSLLGFPVRLDLSWIFIAILLTWTLGVGVFPSLFEDLTAVTYWLMAVAGMLGLFLSIIVHEFAHSVVARRQGMPMHGITLFIFGGVAEMQEAPPSPEAEFKMAIAGPIASVAIAAGCLALGAGGGALGWPVAITGVLTYLATINAVLVVFNAIPAFPLDGGRVLRSFLWRWKDDVRWATRVVSTMGSAFGLVLIVVGIAHIVGGYFVSGIWWALIGMFIRSAAQTSYRQLLIRQALEGEQVARFMSTNPITAPADASLRELVEDYVYRHHHKMYPVIANGKLLGCVTTREVMRVGKDSWDRTRVRDVLEPCAPENTAAPHDPIKGALTKMRGGETSRLMVVEEGRLVGIISLKDVLKFIALKLELEDEQEPRAR
jgi:Zn-dependent protease/predicted transcriptional regulator